METNTAIRKETGHIALGILLGDGIMVLIFALLGKLDHPVILGAVLGSVAALGNFYLMAKTVQRALRDAERAKNLVRRSYGLRMIGLMAVLAVGFKADCFHNVAVAVPLVFPGLTIHAMRLLGMYKPDGEGERT